jgi:hypothetical protein
LQQRRQIEVRIELGPVQAQAGLGDLDNGEVAGFASAKSSARYGGMASSRPLLRVTNDTRHAAIVARGDRVRDGCQALAHALFGLLYHRARDFHRSSPIQCKELGYG